MNRKMYVLLVCSICSLLSIVYSDSIYRPWPEQIYEIIDSFEEKHQIKISLEEEEEFFQLTDVLEPQTEPWSPGYVVKSSFLDEFCNINRAGNYPNPFHLQQYIACGSNSSFKIWNCPDDRRYDAWADTCGTSFHSGCYKPDADPNDKSTWCRWENDCTSKGERRWWSPRALPVNEVGDCGREYFLCGNYTRISTTLECPEGTGFSTGFDGCVKQPFCGLVDEYRQFESKVLMEYLEEYISKNDFNVTFGNFSILTNDQHLSINRMS